MQKETNKHYAQVQKMIRGFEELETFGGHYDGSWINTKEPDFQETKLNLGCGNDTKSGWINVDSVFQNGVDMITDLSKVPYKQFKDNSVDEIYASHILEHFDNPIEVLTEWHRVCKNGARIIIRVPHFSAWANYADPTHKTRFSIKYMDYFTDSDFFQSRKEDRMFRIIEKRLNYFPMHLKSAILNPMFYPFLNWLPNVYERFFWGILPCAEIYWELEVLK
jgi:SAM-dependent methyltransferase